MKTYWVKFEGRKSACVEAESDSDAIRLGTELGGAKAIEATVLPYPAEPRLTKHEYEFTDGSKSVCPSFCHSPEQCKGRTCCPMSYACSE